MSRTLPHTTTRRAGDELLEVRFPIAQRSESGEVRASDAARIGEVRRLATDWASARELAPDVVDDLVVILSELVSNAILHSGGRKVTIQVASRNEEFVRAVVSDGTEKRPVVRHPTDDSEQGRGLQLVEWIAKDRGGGWGVSTDGTVTWCCLPLIREGACRC